MVEGWAQHVDRFAAELDANGDEPYLWGVFDFIGALVVRDIAEDYLSTVPPMARARYSNQLAQADSKLRSYTREDTDRNVLQIAQGKNDQVAWWWSRIPVRGLVPAEAAEMLPRNPSSEAHS
jgi:hypothetical protein